MRKLKLHMQMSVDGFVSGPNGELDWMTWKLDPEIKAFIVDKLTDTSDTILLGRKMTEGFVKHWEQQVAQGSGWDRDLGVRMVNTPKIMFSRTVRQAEGKNLRVENGPLVDSVNVLKRQNGKDIVVYGGSGFVSSLIEHALIDEFNLFVNPAAIGNGMRIFGARTNLDLSASRAYPCGVVVNTYVLKR
jgi:dihydrofolate reductase